MAKSLKKICVLTIAGSDPSGGAGIQSDLKTFRAHGLYGLSVITSLTSQNTLGVHSSFEVPASVIRSQLESLFDDFKIWAIKTGMLSSENVIQELVKFLRARELAPLTIIDPIILSKNNYQLLNEKGVEALKVSLLSLAYLVTPNFPEAELLAEMKIRSKADIEIALKKLHRLGCKNVLLKGGHLPSHVGLPKGSDILYDGEIFTLFGSELIRAKHTHGIGCAFSAAITANLALGKPLKDSIILSKKYIIHLLKKGTRIGKGVSPVEQ